MSDNPRIEELRRRVQADPASIAFAALAEEYRRLGRHDEAVETCLAGLQRHPAYLSARVTLARALVETGDLESAREQFETVLRSAPENLAAIRGLAQIHDRQGLSTEMDPHLAALMKAHIESPPPKEGAAAPLPAPPAIEAGPPPAPSPAPAPPPPIESAPAIPAPEPIRVATPTRPSPPPAFSPGPSASGSDRDLELKRPGGDAPLSAVAPPLTPPNPLSTLAPLADVPFIDVDVPDPAIAAALAGLEQFLTAIQHSRHA